TELRRHRRAAPRRRSRLSRVPDRRPHPRRRPHGRHLRTRFAPLAPLRSAALDHFRSEARRVRREDRYAVRELREVHPPSFGEGLSPELEHALAELSRAEREVVALRVVLGRDGGTASRVLGISPSACSTRLTRA